MIKYTITIKDRRYEFIDEKSTKSRELIEQNIKQDEVSEFYTDENAFIDKYCSMRLEHISKSLWYINTSESGYDTYDSAVWCSYTEQQAIESSEARMGRGYINSAEHIGFANKNLELGEVVSSFNAG